jgi:hypothetical protein
MSVSSEEKALNSALFYQFYPATNAPDNAPVVMWL